MTPNLQTDIFNYLVILRDSGVTNMLFAPKYLMEEFDLNKHDALKVFGEWCDSLRGTK